MGHKPLRSHPCRNLLFTRKFYDFSNTGLLASSTGFCSRKSLLQLAWGIGGGGAALQTQLLVAMGLPKLKTPDLLLKIDQFNTGNRASGFSIGEVFHVIHPNSVFGDIINYYPPVGFENHIPRFTLNGILNIQFTDWNNEDIDFNGEDWTLALGVKWGVDTGIAGFESSNLDLNYRPLTHQYPRHYDPLDGNKKRLRR